MSLNFWEQLTFWELYKKRQKKGEKRKRTYSSLTKKDSKIKSTIGSLWCIPLQKRKKKFKNLLNDKQNSKTINNELATQLEIDISFNKILFNLPLKPTDSEIENLKHTFSNYIQNTKYDYYYLRKYIIIVSYFTTHQENKFLSYDFKRFLKEHSYYLDMNQSII